MGSDEYFARNSAEGEALGRLKGGEGGAPACGAQPCSCDPDAQRARQERAKSRAGQRKSRKNKVDGNYSATRAHACQALWRFACVCIKGCVLSTPGIVC